MKLNVSLNVEDALYWLPEKSGHYSVKSAYKLFLQLDGQGGGESSREKSINSFWKCLWHLKIPKKIKNLGWKACLENLPTYINLRKKKIMLDDKCVFCNQTSEDAAHVLFYCSDVFNAWS